MSEPATLEPKMIHSEQALPPNSQEKPWLRQKNEPANWYMRFKCYLDLGPKRSLRAVVASDPVSQKATKSNAKQQKNESQKSTAEVKSISEVSVPGAWSRAAKVWNWKERAQAYDLAEQEKEAQKIRKMANTLPHASKSYRIIKLDYLARLLEGLLEPENLKGHNAKDIIPLIVRYQSVLRDIEQETQGLDRVTQDACDNSAMIAVREHIIEHKYKEKLKTKDQSERNRAAFERHEAIEKLNKKKS